MGIPSVKFVKNQRLGVQDYHSGVLCHLSILSSSLLPFVRRRPEPPGAPPPRPRPAGAARLSSLRGVTVHCRSTGAPSRLPESLDSRLSVSKAPIYKTNHPRVTHDTRDATVSNPCPAIIGHSLAAHAHAPTRPTPLDGADRVRAGELLERRHLRRRHGRLCAAPAEDLAAHRKRPRRLVEAEQER